MQEVDIKV